MHISGSGNAYRISRITGPHHNTLLLTFAGAPVDGPPAIDALPAVGGCTHAPLDPELISRYVLHGLSEANREFGASYAVQRIGYVVNDTRPEHVYALLAYSLVKHLVSLGEDA